jgi:hypothetical protein
MSHTTLIAHFVGLVCERFTAQLQRTSKALGSILQILRNKTRGLTCGFTNVLGGSGTLLARALKGAHSEPHTRRARWVAAVIGIALSIPMAVADGGSIDAIQSIKELADTQLTEKQEYCHNQIVYKESRFVKSAQNGSHHGYYQGRSTALIGAPDDYQFYWFYSYTANRYGLTQYDEPNYCKSLHHLIIKGWQ